MHRIVNDCTRAQDALWDQKMRAENARVIARLKDNLRLQAAERDPCKQAVRADRAAEGARRKACQDKRSGDIQQAIADAVPDPSLDVAKRAKPPTAMVFLGLPLGAPARTLRVCDLLHPEDRRTCRMDLAPDSSASSLVTTSKQLVALTFMASFPVPADGTVLLNVENQPWLRLAYARVKNGVLVSLLFATEPGDAVPAYLRKHYGKPTAQDGDGSEWILPGLHISYQPPEVKSVPSVPRHPEVRYECKKDYANANCDRSDEVQAELSHQLGQGFADLMIYGPTLRAAATANLIVETETEHRAAQADKP